MCLSLCACSVFPRVRGPQGISSTEFSLPQFCPSADSDGPQASHKPSLMVLSRALNLPRLQVLHPCLTPLTHRSHRGVFGGRNTSKGIDIFLWFGVSKGKDDWAITKHSQKGSSICSTLGCDVSLQNGEISFNQEKSWFLIPCRKLLCQTVAL